MPIHQWKQYHQPTETKDLITDLIDNEDINPTALFTYSTKRNKHNIT